MLVFQDYNTEITVFIPIPENIFGLLIYQKLSDNNIKE